ncbi:MULTISPECIES: sigma-70 family RNA polymerase sigma factor [Rhodoplanes]|nr:sigma-70 family RNA polymerase sigma factor [Rhodoplanes serenus]MBI5110650.1 sigma-70 family RNA polymerase sigma factor [Rhodovulum sp.]RAI32073.1 RNA polymerase subunit sigma [Rhodoplanes serenus]
MARTENDWSDLMRLAIAGDSGAYERCLRDMTAVLRVGVRRAVTRAGLAAGEAEDIVQEILLAVHLKRHTWDTTRPIGPWLQAVARHKTIDAIRRRGGRSGVPLDDVVETLPAPSEEPTIRETELVRALDSLPPGERAAVTAIALDGASFAEAAVRLGTTEGALRVALHRGLARLARTAHERT